MPAVPATLAFVATADPDVAAAAIRVPALDPDEAGANDHALGLRRRRFLFDLDHRYRSDLNMTSRTDHAAVRRAREQGDE
jgi:hypothetical protein